MATSRNRTTRPKPILLPTKGSTPPPPLSDPQTEAPEDPKTFSKPCSMCAKRKIKCYRTANSLACQVCKKGKRRCDHAGNRWGRSATHARSQAPSKAPSSPKVVDATSAPMPPGSPSPSLSQRRGRRQSSAPVSKGQHSMSQNSLSSSSLTTNTSEAEVVIISRPPHSESKPRPLPSPAPTAAKPSHRNKTLPPRSPSPPIAGPSCLRPARCCPVLTEGGEMEGGRLSAVRKNRSHYVRD